MTKKHILSLLISLFSIAAFGQGTESFTNIPANSGTYATNNWTGDNALAWSATDSRTDQVMTGRAITLRNGSVFCNAIQNGITNLSFNHKQFFTGSGSVLQVYINGTLIGTANPTTTQATASFTNINIGGSFNLEIRQVTAGLRIGIDDVSWTSFGGTPCVEPANQPTGLNLTPTINSVSGNFTAASPAVDGYLIVRSLSSALTINPADGTTYTAGQTLGNGTIVTSGASTSFTDNGLSSNTLYYYFVFSYNSISCTGAPNYLTVNPLTNSVTTLSLPACTTPSAPPTTLVLTPAPTSISGSFTAEPTANRYLVVYSQNNTLGFTPANGTTYTAGQVIGPDRVASYGSTTSFTITGLNSLTIYHVFVFAANGSCTGEPFYNTTSLDGSATTTNSGIPPGYYDAAVGLSCQNLKTALRNIITTGQIALNYSTIDNTEIPAVDTIRSDYALRSIIWDI